MYLVILVIVGCHTDITVARAVTMKFYRKNFNKITNIMNKGNVFLLAFKNKLFS